ncbi:divergent polysaccharide deacetylase family protein [Escherichia coli]
MRAAQGTGVKVIKRKVFLDDSQNEADIRVRFNRAINLAHHNGSTSTIGHPHPQRYACYNRWFITCRQDVRW